MKYHYYLPVLKKIIKNPPNSQAIYNYIKYKINFLTKKEIVSNTPVSVVFYATKKCNLSCNFCHSKHVLNIPNSELTQDQLISFLQSSLGKNTLRVGFLGGEPFLNQDIFTLIKLAHQYKKVTTAVTNATLFLDNTIMIQQLLNSNLTALGISLYHNNKDAVIYLANNIKHQQVFWVQTVVTAHELDKIEPLIQLAIKNKFSSLKIDNCHPITEDNLDNVIFDDNDTYNKLHLYLLDKYRDKINLTLPIPIRKKAEHIKPKCTMYYSYIHVDNKGDIGACCMRPPNQQWGNIQDPNFWNTAIFKKLRAEMFIDQRYNFQCRYCDSLENDLYGI